MSQYESESKVHRMPSHEVARSADPNAEEQHGGAEHVSRKSIQSEVSKIQRMPEIQRKGETCPTCGQAAGTNEKCESCGKG